MDVGQVERITRDVIASEALPFTLVAVNEDEMHRIEIGLRAVDGRALSVHVTSFTTPAELRQLLCARLEAEI